MTVLIASCIRQKPEILREFLESLDKLEKPCEPHYFFITTLDEESKSLLEEWAVDKDVTIREEKVDEQFIVDEDTHHWTTEHVKTLMRLRDIYLDEARKGEYEYLFAVDSDIYFHPETLVKLLHNKKDIITEIHWTKWYADDAQILPNVWFYDNYGFPTDGLHRLKREKIVKVGGICGAYLISKKALKAGVSFAIAKGVPEHWGEDRHFAVRAQSLGLDLWCDTTLPSFHIYRMSDLPRLQSWKDNGFKENSESMKRILVAVPHTGTLRAELVAYLLNLVDRCARGNRLRLSVDLSWGIPVDSNRNSIVKKLLGTDNEWLLTIDSDIGPPPMVLEELLSHGKKVVGAVCWSSMGGEEGGRWESFGIPYPVVMSKNPKGGWNVDRKTVASGKRLVECDAGSTACLLLHREVLEAIEPPWFRLQYDENGVCNAGEDFTFFDKVKAKGYGVYVDLALQCGHYKTTEIKRFNDLLTETARKPDV